jgi:hypothetical protein
MDAIDPHTAQVLGAGVAAAAMVVLAQGKSMVQLRPLERCGTCKRLLGAGRRCPKCG